MTAPATAGATGPLPRIWLTLPLLIVALLLVLDTTDVDRLLEARFFDAGAGAFPLRYHPFFEVVLHHWAKYLVALLVCGALAGYFLSFVLPGLQAGRRLFLFVALGIILSTGAVSAAKLASSRHCPWDLAEYGGELPYTPLLEAESPDGKPGHCFPAGHASTGFSLLTLYFAGVARRSARLARLGLGIGLGAGLGLGIGRMLQGAHFLSHVLWAGVLCWSVIAIVYCAVAPWSHPSAEAAPGSR